MEPEQVGMGQHGALGCSHPLGEGGTRPGEKERETGKTGGCRSKLGLGAGGTLGGKFQPFELFPEAWRCWNRDCRDG